VFAGYRIESILDRGGMGVVYKAIDEDLERTVALKIIAPEHTQDPTAVARFKAEARLAASLEHPNIVPIHRGGEEEGILYLAMRFVPGTNLRRVIDRGPVELGRIAHIITDVADALDAAHASGLVHRDVKPANILVSGPPEHEHVYLTDFGLTKRLGSVGDLTKTGGWVGTPDYVAPEQIRGRSVDGRADIYSLGCVLYEMLTGHVAYPKDSDVAKLWAHVTDPPPLPGTERPDLVEAFDEVVARATAKDPDDRYATAGELATAVRRAVAEQQTEVARQAAQDTELDSDSSPAVAGKVGPAAAAAGEVGPAAAAAGAAASQPASPARPRTPGSRRRWIPIAAVLALLAAGGVTAAILLSDTSGDQPRGSPQQAASSEPPGQPVSGELAAVPYSKVTGVGNVVIRLNGTRAAVSLNAEGLLDGQPHAMHIHAGKRGQCPPGGAARQHGGHLVISTVDGLPWYGGVVTSLTSTGSTSKDSFLSFTRFPKTGKIGYTRDIHLSKAVAAVIRADNAVVIVHGIDYNHNGFYDFNSLDRSDLKRSLPGEMTAPALCGPLEAAPVKQSGGTGTKTGRVQTYTASLQQQGSDFPAWLCPLGASSEDRPKQA
jgi:hypothetical protein